MFCSRSRLWICILASLAAAGCGGRQSPSVADRLAILRFENVGQDPGFDWMGRVLSEAVAGSLSRQHAISTEALRGFDQVMGVRGAAIPGISAERTQALLAGAGRIGYGQYSVKDGRVSAQLTVQSATGSKVLQLLSASGPEQGLLGLAEILARRVSPNAVPYETRNLGAARAYAAALEASTPDASIALLGQAVAEDPAFAAAYLSLARLKSSLQDRVGAERALEQGLANSAQTSPQWRARLEFELATLRGDAEGRTRALEALAKATPEDASVWRAIADAAFVRREYTAALGAYRKALAIQPNDTTLLNQMGYTLAAAGDFNGATDALTRYRSLRPNEPNPLDSLGDVHYESGRFKEAADFYLQAHGKDAAFLGAGTLYKAALARLMSGDVPGADALAKQYMEARTAAGDPIIEYRKADWSWTSGRRKEAFERLAVWAGKAEAGPSRELASRAYSQLAVWSLAVGNREKAVQAASRAASLSGPASAAMAALSSFLAQPGASASEWAIRAERMFPQPQQAPLRSFARAYALLFGKDFANAAVILREMYQAGSAAADQSIPTLLGWAYLESGKIVEAAPLLSRYPIPPPEGPMTFGVLQMPRILYLRGLLAEKQNQPEPARQLYRTFLLLSGSEPLVWGEEAAASARSGQVR